MDTTANELIHLAQRLRESLAELDFSSVAYVYQPLEYAWDAHCEYIRKYGCAHRQVVFLGMNPGPFGMAQTGVPFGEIAVVRDWLKIESSIGKPLKEHPKRPIEGFACKRSEVSGRRLWGLFARRFDSADVFFQHHFVLNYCPLLFTTETGSNLTPDKLPFSLRNEIEGICDTHLQAVLTTLSPQWAVGIGGYAEQRLQDVQLHQLTWEITRILHPSPASPSSNRGDWGETAERQLISAGVWMDPVT